MAKISINVTKGALEPATREIVVGIDLGTTNSLVAVVNPDTGRPETLGKDGSVIVPSIVYLSPDGIPVVGEIAKNSLIHSPESTIFSVKRLLGRSYQDLKSHADFLSYRIVDSDTEQLVKVEANGRYYSPVELSAYILQELKRKAEAATGALVDKAVITVPAYFNDSQRQATRDAGKLAGLDVLRIVNEPTAASLAYGIGLNDTEEKTILVYDLGGGTFDVSVLHIANGVFEVLATNGDTYLGGDDLDRAVAEWWKSEQPQLAALTNRNDQQKIRLMAEEAKRWVCSGKGDFTGQLQLVQEDLSLKLTYGQFVTLAEPLIAKTLDCTRRALQDAGLKAADFSEVVLVGGSTRIPAVKQSLEALFPGVNVDDSLNPDEVVALGAAVEADILAGNRKDILLLDVTPLSLGIETVGGLMDVIIPRNSKVPSRAGRQYTTSIDGQVNLKVTVFQGERELVSENRKLAEFTLKGIPAMPAGLPKVEIGFMLDADGILKVSAEELRSGVRQEIEVQPQYGLTDQMVEEMLLNSMLNARQDVDQRMVVEAQTEGRQLIYTAERFIEKNKNLLEDSEIAETIGRLNALKQKVATDDKDGILAAIDALNEYTRPFAERLMDMAIGKALKGTSIDN